jgi:hypothetical protein
VERLREARALLQARCWSGAYYLAGYAVECGLKACIIKWLMATDQFPERRYSEQCWTHNIERLVDLAGLKGKLDADAAADPNLNGYWGTVNDRDEASRYKRTIRTKAEGLYKAVADKQHGVFAWIKSHW